MRKIFLQGGMPLWKLSIVLKYVLHLENTFFRGGPMGNLWQIRVQFHPWVIFVSWVFMVLKLLDNNHKHFCNGCKYPVCWQLCNCGLGFPATVCKQDFLPPVHTTCGLGFHKYTLPPESHLPIENHNKKTTNASQPRVLDNAKVATMSPGPKHIENTSQMDAVSLGSP